MKLHENTENFIYFIEQTANYFGIDESYVEKDYYVTLFLEKAAKEITGLVFKGGTSLAKCHKVINRFSEDIDLTLDSYHATQSKKREAYRKLVEICDELGLTLENREQILSHTHGTYNCYSISYPMLYKAVNISPKLKVEMTFIQKCYPTDSNQKADSYIGEYMKANGVVAAVSEYEMGSFLITTQGLQRTLIDKVFALCDYSMRGVTERISRHIYDISKLLEYVELSDELTGLIRSVREDRKPNRLCVSAQDGVDIQSVLGNIIDTEMFKNDYEVSTERILTESYDYEKAVYGLQQVINSRLFSEEKYKTALVTPIPYNALESVCGDKLLFRMPLNSEYKGYCYYVPDTAVTYYADRKEYKLDMTSFKKIELFNKNGKTAILTAERFFSEIKWLMPEEYGERK